MVTDRDNLRFGELGAYGRHLCVDMQKLFAEPTEWKTPWMDRIRPHVHRLVSASPSERSSHALFRRTGRVRELELGAATMSAGRP